MKEALEAINRFCYESLNFEVVRYKFQFVEAYEYVPKFLTEITWSANTDHFVNKWIKYRNDSGSNEEVFIRFYVNLDRENQDKMAEWIFKNGAHTY